VHHLATLKDATGRIQPITARPAGTPLTTTSSGTKRIYYVGTGRYLGDGLHGGISDLADPGLASGIAWQQSIYGIKDDLDAVPAGWGDIRAGGNLVPQTLSALSSTVRRITKNAVNWDTKAGFVIDLDPDLTTPGERVVLDVRLILKTLLVTSTIPSSSGCTPGGTSFQYNLDYRTGGYVTGSVNGAAGTNLGQFVVGTAVAQTVDGLIKALNKDYSGENTPTTISIDRDPTKLKRFSYRER
jgi:type IV pilus assembly protein PilY1